MFACNYDFRFLNIYFIQSAVLQRSFICSSIYFLPFNGVFVFLYPYRYAAIKGDMIQKQDKNAPEVNTICLPSSESFTSVYKQYKNVCHQVGKKELGLTSFKKIWNSQVCHVKVPQKNNQNEEVSGAQPVLDMPGKDYMYRKGLPTKKKGTGSSIKRQCKIKDIPSKKSRPNNVNQDEHIQSAQAVNSSSGHFDIGSSDCVSQSQPHAPIMSFSMYLNDGTSNMAALESPFQHNMVMSHHHNSLSHPHQNNTPQGSILPSHPVHHHLDNISSSSSSIHIGSMPLQSIPSSLHPAPPSNPLSTHTPGPVNINIHQRNFTISRQPFLPSAQAGLHGHQWYMQ